jgi:hypothetical protein
VLTGGSAGAGVLSTVDAAGAATAASAFAGIFDF